MTDQTTRLPIRRALISVSDKTGILDFARELEALGVEILSTGRIDQEMGLAMTRAIARSVDRLASWLSSLAMESVRRHEVGEQLHLRPPDPAPAGRPLD